MGAQTVSLSASAYRVFGQPDLRQNSVNHTIGAEMWGPSGIAIDSRKGTVAIYVADTRNNRILAWRDISQYTLGAAADFVLGQPDLKRTTPLGIGAKGLNFPLTAAVDPIRGDLYIADYGNNRILRYRSPLDSTATEPDAVYGQPDFVSFAPNNGGTGAGTLRGPQALSFDNDGNLWISDTGNHRVLRYPQPVLDSTGAQADLVIGQKDFFSTAVNQGANAPSGTGLDTPLGLAFDKTGALYVADYNNTRVLKFKGPFATGAAASAVYGQANLTTRGIAVPPTASRIGRPAAVTADDTNLYVASPLDNRVLVYSLDKPSVTATGVLGQPSFAVVTANTGAAPQSSGTSLSVPADLKVDRNGSLWIVDSGNNRVVGYRSNEKAASTVLGQPDLWSNGVNRVKPEGLSGAYKIAIDYTQAPFAIYVSDTGNNRVLGWYDVVAYRNGMPADFAIGQPSLYSGSPNVDSGAGASGQTLSLPRGIILDSAGNLFVADSGNNRVLRFPRPVSQTGRIAADLVLGQPDFNTFNVATTNASVMKSPSSVALGANEEIFVADTGNNRVLEFPPSPASSVAAVRVFGQGDFISNARPSLPSGQTLDGPLGVAVDASGSVYIADTRTNRVLVFPDPESMPATAAAAAIVIGQDKLSTNVATSGASRLRGPSDVGVDGAGNIYVADTANHRIAIFPPLLFLPSSGAPALAVIGQPNFTNGNANWNAPDGFGLQATPEGLFSPSGLFVDRFSTLYVADSGNSRVVHYLRTVRAVNAANWQDGVAVGAGSLVALTGADLSAATETASGGYAPALGQRSVMIDDDQPMQLGYVSPTQFNAQIPYRTAVGNHQLAIRASDTGELIAGAPIGVSKQSPGLFTVSQDGKGQALAFNQDGSPNGTAAPAVKGSVIKFFGTGQGPLDQPLDDGSPAPSDNQVKTLATPTTDGRTCLGSPQTMCFPVGSVFGEIVFSGLAPGKVGVWEIDVRVPATALSGATIPVRAVVNGTLSNIVTIAIK